MCIQMYKDIYIMNIVWLRLFQLKTFENIRYRRYVYFESTNRKTFVRIQLLLLKSNCGKVVLAEKHRPENRPKEYLGKFCTLTSVRASNCETSTRGETLDLMNLHQMLDLFVSRSISWETTK